ncbi:MAG TPA: efflux RND transporter periplasmic adaptor subunit [Candidatus Baltobacteraceae bacterium]|nr:efflux RND transporter periplasmic adaptor subunit [Candidatus Baltobacteraceae bacterium]
MTLRYALTVLIALPVLAGCARNSAATASAPPAVSMVAVREGTYVERVPAVGRIGAVAGAETKLAFAVPGVLQDVAVRIGQRVTAGEALAQLDTSGLSLAAMQAQAEAQAASASAQQAAVDRTTAKIAVDRAALGRERILYGAGVAALKDVQAARAQLAADRAEASVASAGIRASNAQARSARARAALARRDLNKGTLRSPIDGVVTAVYRLPGEAVDTTTPVLAVAPGSTNDLTLDVASTDASRVHVGDSVELQIVGTHASSTGEVIGIPSALDPTTQAATVLVHGVPTNAPGGSAVQASIAVARDRGIVIPQSAIVQDPQTGATLVFAQTRDSSGAIKFDQRQVTVAHQNGTQALIASGLRAGERIAARGGFALLAP